MFLLADFQWREAWHRGEVRGKGEGKKRTRRKIGGEEGERAAGGAAVAIKEGMNERK